MIRRVHISKKRRHILRVLLAADRPLSAVTISQKTDVTVDSVSLSLDRMTDYGWLAVEGPPFRRQNVTRYFTLLPHVRDYIKTVILGDTDDEERIIVMVSGSGPQLLSSTTQHILRVLLDAEEPMWALQITTKAGVPYGTGYEALKRLKQHNWISTTLETAGTHPGRPAHLFYQLTKTGRTQAEAALGGRDTSADS